MSVFLEHLSIHYFVIATINWQNTSSCRNVTTFVVHWIVSNIC